MMGKMTYINVQIGAQPIMVVIIMLGRITVIKTSSTIVNHIKAIKTVPALKARLGAALVVVLILRVAEASGRDGTFRINCIDITYRSDVTCL